MPKPKTNRIIFRDKLGRFVAARDRYTSKVHMVQAKRGKNKKYTTLMERTPTPKSLVDLLTQREFEALPEAIVPVKDVESRSKYRAWDIAQKIDKMKGIRRKSLKITMEVFDGKRRKNIVFYHKIKRNTPSSYALFAHMNEALFGEGIEVTSSETEYTMVDQKGAAVTLGAVHVEEVI